MRFLSTILDKFRAAPNPGSSGEQLAAQFLKRHGYRILARNLRTRFGEIDLLAEAPDRRTVVVVEVKTAESDAAGPDLLPEVRVNPHKQRKLVTLACQVARQYRLSDRPIRFDIIGVTLPHVDRPAAIRHYPGAFESQV